MRRAIHGAVAEPAIDPFVTRVVTVVELNGLFDRILHSSSERASDIAENPEHSTGGAAAENQERQACDRIMSWPKQ
jgi:hypothetical protein